MGSMASLRTLRGFTLRMFWSRVDKTFRFFTTRGLDFDLAARIDVTLLTRLADLRLSVDFRRETDLER